MPQATISELKKGILHFLNKTVGRKIVREAVGEFGIHGAAKHIFDNMDTDARKHLGASIVNSLSAVKILGAEIGRELIAQINDYEKPVTMAV